jgi:hypothetical protein
MSKVFFQAKDLDVETLMASVREGNEVVLKDGDEEVASVTQCPPKPEGGRRGTFGLYKGAVWSDDGRTVHRSRSALQQRHGTSIIRHRGVNLPSTRIRGAGVFLV